MRSLGLNPTQEQLRDIITELRGEDSMSGFVEFERFEKVMMRVLTEQMVGHQRRERRTQKKNNHDRRVFQPTLRAVATVSDRRFDWMLSP